MDRGAAARHRHAGPDRSHDGDAGLAGRALVASACPQGLPGRQCDLAGWPGAAARHRPPVCAARRRQPRSAGGLGYGARPPGFGPDAAHGRAGREQAAGACVRDDGIGISAQMMEAIMPATLQPSTRQALPLHAATRRELLLGSGVLFAWAFMPQLAQAEGRDPRFLTIVLRGALDGLAAVAPVGDPDWIKLRGDNALRLDGKTPALPLDGFFALNPAMPNVHRLYQAGEATIVHAAATPYRDRSHFDGQDVLESGLPKPGAVDSGWLNRALAGLAPSEPVNPRGRQAFAVGPVTPLVVRGPASVLSWTPARMQPAS